MRRFIVLLTLAVLALPAMSYASIYGVLKGKVVDTEGKGAIGASVRIEGTTLGAFVRSANGEFTVANIVAGTYKVKITAVGKSPYVVEVRITADQVTSITATLRDESVKTDVVEVIGRKNEMVDNSAVGSKNVLSGEDLTNIAREGIASIVGMSAGVTNTGGGFSMRGSRDTESQIRYNGMDIGNQFTGGFGGAGSYYAPIVSTYATEEVQVLKGSFTAEHGEALGGIVNTVPKTGRTEGYEGFLRYRTDAAALWGSQKNGLKVIRDGTKNVAIDYGPGAKLQGKNEHLVEFGIGGPLPFLGKSTFYISTNYLYEQNRSASYKIFDPDGNNLGLRPDNQAWRKNITGVLSFALTDDIKLITGGMFGLSNFESSSSSWLYANEEGTPYMLNGKVDVNGVPTPNGIPERIAKQNVINILLNNVYARINHTLTASSFYELTVSSNVQNEVSSRRKGWEDPSYFGGYDVYEPQDKYVYDGVTNKIIPAPGGIGDKIIDFYQPISEIRYSADGYLRKDFLAKNPLTGYYEGAGNATGTNNAWGMANAFYTHGNGSSIEFREGSYFQVDGSYTNVFKTGDFDHNAKTGFELRFIELHRHSNSWPWDGNPFYDIYTDRWGGNLYADNAEQYKESSNPFNPSKFAAYVQDQVSYKGIVISAGLRLDMFDANSKYRTVLNKFTDIVTQPETFKETDMKYQISPRINITYPITERSNLSIAYGMYFKTPLLSNLYDNFNATRIRSGNTLGNPNMEAEKSRQYEVAYRNQLTEDFVLTITSYFKDVYNQLGIIYVAATPDPFNLLDVTEYSNSRGIEVELAKRASDNLAFSINYTLSYSDGTSSSAFENASIQIDPYSQKPTFPLATYPLSNDIRHVINYNLYMFWRKNEGPSIGGIYLLENASISFTGGFQTGLPYTRLDLNYRPISERNSDRGPSYWSLDSRIAKAFFLKDWFGNSVGNTRFELFADIRNVLNMRGPSGFYTTTGDPVDNGRTLDREVGTFSATPFYKEASYAESASFRSDQYDSYGNRLYNEKADLDGNGIVTQLEKYQAYLNQAETSMKFRSLFRAPIRIYVGLNLYF